MKVMITGSRSLANNKETKRDVYEALDALLAKDTEMTLLSGKARGVDRIAEQWARKQKVPVNTYAPDYKRHKRGAPFVCNQEMIDACDGVVAFWDGTSKGTKHVLDRAGAKLLWCVNYAK